MKKVLGLDIGTNSIGAALIILPSKFEDYGLDGNIEWMGSRIIPTDAEYLKKYEEGQTSGVETKAAARRSKRGSRRLKHRYKLRRTKLIKVFKTLGWIDENFPLDDSKTFKKKINGENDFKFSISKFLPFSESTINEFKTEMGITNKKRFDKKKNKEVDYLLPEDWIIYYLRTKAHTQKIEISELARIIYMMNQRRGFKSSRKDLKDSVVLPYDEFINRKANGDYKEGIETQFVCITTVNQVKQLSNDPDKNGKYKFQITVADNKIDSSQFVIDRKRAPEWEGKIFTFLVVQKIDKNGKFIQNTPQAPKEDNWGLCTTALDEKINEETYPGKYFFNELKAAFKEGRNFKIRQYPIYRWRYKNELEKIWHTQLELNPELQKINNNPETLAKLAQMLYPTQVKRNMLKLTEFKNHDLLHIISNHIIYYQRELKSQKNSISECRYEKRKGIDGETYGLKCIPRSSPLFQEFRIWQDIHNMRILEREVKQDGKTLLDVDVTKNFINSTLKEKFFELFNKQANVSEKNILELIKENYPDSKIKLDIDKKENIHSHRVNLFANREELKGNETLSRYRNVFKKAEFIGDNILNDKEQLQKLWHIDYSITSADEDKSKKGITTALTSLLSGSSNKNKLIEIFCKLSELKKEYGSYSAMAIKKMLPLMRCGKYWNEEDINEETKNRIQKIADGEFDETITSETRDKIKKWEKEHGAFSTLQDFNGLPTWLAGYVVYGQHSERDKKVIQSVEEFGKYIQKEIPNNSLRNPIVEKVVREAMFLVRDIWKEYGNINEIHIEIGRDLKNNLEERKRIADQQKNNFEEKQRIKKLLYELLSDGIDQYIDTDESKPFNWKTQIETNKEFEVKPNPESPVDIEKFRLWRTLSRNTDAEWEKKVKEEKIPTEQQLKKYALWLSQNCRSPYTGKIIPLSKLFDTTQYEIEHIIPRRKMKNDGFNNLVIAEWGVNKAKDNQLAANFISNSKGKCSYGDKEYTLFTYEEYDAYCRETFKFQKSKRKNLLATEVPEDFIERQLNDTRYIGRKLSELLAPVTKTEDGNSNENGILFTIGSITSELKNKWGLNSVWKKIIYPRFERLEKITGKNYIVHDVDEFGNPVIHFNVPENPELNIKRIDHRHHALDALIIATTTREHIRYLNTLNAADTNEEFKKYRFTLVKGKIRDFKQPWQNFTEDAKNKLEETIVTFKSNTNIISKPQNRHIHGFTEKGKPIRVEQKQNPRWMAVRRSMFKEPQGIVYLKEVCKEKNILKAIEIQINRMLVQNTPAMALAPYVYDKEARKIIKDLIERIGIGITEKDALLNEIKKYLRKNKLKNFDGQNYEYIDIAEYQEYACKRVKLDKSFDHKKINKIPYSKIGKSTIAHLLHEHLNSAEYEQKPELAFSTEGLEALSKKAGKPITKVTIAEQKDESSKFGKQYVEVDAGANAYFIIYENKITRERKGSSSIAIHKAIERLNDKTKEGIADKEDGYDLIILSPGDLVYIPTFDERQKIKDGISILETIPWNNKKHLSAGIYKMTDTTQGKCLFVPYCISSKIGNDGVELGSGNKSARAWDGKVEYKPDSKGKLSREDSGTMIKDVCIKLNIDRLGNIKPFTHTSSQKENNNIISEPEVIYKKFKIFGSHEEANEADAKAKANISPEQHLINVTERIKQTYADELKTPMDKTLKFRDND